MRRTASALLAALTLSACHYYFEDDPPGTPSGDGGPASDADTDPTTDAAVDCDPIAVLPAGFQPVASVSTAAVDNQVESAAQNIHLTTVDASAGGAANQASEPAVYLRLECGGPVVVNIDDVSGFESTAWDLALKRYVIRTNGGDSGPGGATVGRVASEELTADPDPPVDFRADDWTAADCTLVQDQIAGPRTRFSTWYSVEGGRLEPRSFVFALRLPGDRRAQVDIQTYYGDPEQPAKSGVYVLRWRMFGCTDG
jgi:hypothetical protein